MTDEERLIRTLNKFEGYSVSRLTPTTKINEDMYYGEPVATKLFLNAYNFARETLRRPTRLYFLDVGCGTGGKCLLAGDEDCAAVGLEFNPEYVTYARSLGVTVHDGDARDYKLYHRYDIVYVSNPMRGEEEVKLEQMIWSKLNPASLLITINGKMPTPENAKIIYTDGLANIYSNVNILRQE